MFEAVGRFLILSLIPPTSSHISLSLNLPIRLADFFSILLSQGGDPRGVAGSHQRAGGSIWSVSSIRSVLL